MDAGIVVVAKDAGPLAPPPVEIGFSAIELSREIAMTERANRGLGTSQVGIRVTGGPGTV